MRIVPLFLMCVASLSWAQDTEIKPQLTDEPLTSEEVAIYRTFLRIYAKGSDTPLNLADVTDPISSSPAEFKGGQGCLNRIPAESLKQANAVVHRLDPSVAADLNVILVNPEKQIAIVKENDPQKALGLDDKDGDKKESDKEIHRAVAKAFGTALFTFSEIAFDKKHTWAALTFSFYCGSLCGNGDLLLFHKVNKKWKLARRDCDPWVS